MAVKWRVLELYVPRFMNDGSRVPLEHREAFRAQIIERFGGFTKIDSAHGVWKNDAGLVVAEPVYIYRILTDKPGVGAVACIRTLAAYVRINWRQESVLWTCSDVVAEFFTGE